MGRAALQRLVLCDYRVSWEPCPERTDRTRHHRAHGGDSLRGCRSRCPAHFGYALIHRRSAKDAEIPMLHTLLSQCSSCKTALTSSPEGQHMVAGFNAAILFLLAVPFLLVSVSV